MIANAKTMQQAAACACTAKFLSLLPQIQEQARFAFRHEGAEQRDELIAEVVANCWVAFVRLVDRGLMDAPETPEGYRLGRPLRPAEDNRETPTANLVTSERVSGGPVNDHRKTPEGISLGRSHPPSRLSQSDGLRRKGCLPRTATAAERSSS